MNYKIIVAKDSNNGIGINNKLPWNIKNDMKKFVELTKGNGNNAIIMGKNTWLSLPKKPLANRYNIILSTTLNNNDFSNKNIKVINNINEAILFCKNKFDNIWIIGGEKIYTQFLEKGLIQEIYITEIENDFKCDCFFPKINLNEWSLIKYDLFRDNNYNIYNKLYIKK
jgi:dihydrofolate reductase